MAAIDEVADRIHGQIAAAVAWDRGTAPVRLNDLRALLAEIERLRAVTAGKRRVRAFAAQYRGGTIAHGTVTDTERGTWDRMELPEFGVSRERLEAEGWRVVPVEITWEDGNADE